MLIRLKGILTPAERHLAEDADGIQLIKQVRAKLLENSSKMLAEVIMGITLAKVVSLHRDVSTRAGEGMIIIPFVQNLEKRCR